MHASCPPGRAASACPQSGRARGALQDARPRPCTLQCALDREAEILAVRDDAHRHVVVAVRLDGAPADGERLRLDVRGEPAGAAEDDLAGAELVRRPRDRWRWRYLACRLGRPESPVALDALFPR